MRLERFGASALSGTTTANSTVKIRSDEEAKAARAEKFGIETDEAKLQKRKARFGLA
ncbi:unnamed protein product [Echinostoma caproni]|uniref:Tho1_MOS11_C domain-containing protein n=1 Tax=Echinostoma caproni TaxID=27848 RepID=A0A183AP88_9TREM|nr:unnamed protein product [Echinostoma caproni]